MTTKFAAVPPGMTVARTLEHLRAVAPAVETVATVYILDAAGTLVGVCSIRELLMAAPHDMWTPSCAATS